MVHIVIVQAEASQFKVGESWRLKEQNVGDKKEPGEYTNTVYSVEADKVMFAGQDTACKYWWEYNPIKLRYVALCTNDDKADKRISRKTRGLTKDKLLFAFPMAVGSIWAYKSFCEDGANKGDSETDAKVVAYEKVIAPAGTFDAFKIEYLGF